MLRDEKVTVKTVRINLVIVIQCSKDEYYETMLFKLQVFPFNFKVQLNTKYSNFKSFLFDNWQPLVEMIHGTNIVPTDCGLIFIFEETPTNCKHMNKQKAKTETSIKFQHDTLANTKLRVRKALTT